jgi:hypothetical protein
VEFDGKDDASSVVVEEDETVPLATSIGNADAAISVDLKIAPV